MAIIIDPDNLNDGTEIVIAPSTKTVRLVQTGNLSADGVTVKCVYSKLKELWKNSSTYIKYPFPMQPITDEQFEMINGWDWYDDSTRYLLRNGGWAVKNDSGVSLEEWAGIITLGDIDGSSVPGVGTDQVYFQQSTNPKVNFQRTGAVNQAIKIYGDATHGDFDYRSSLTLFVRAQGKTFNSSNLTTIGVSTMSYQAYRFPLSNSVDLKVTHTDAQIIGQQPYFGSSEKSGSAGSVTQGSAAFSDSGANFSSGDVGKWICISSGSNVGVYRVTAYTSPTQVTVDRNFGQTESGISWTLNPAGMSITWYASAQQRSIGGTNRDFHVIIDGNLGTLEQIYEFVQYMLRQAQDIDSGAGTKIGNVTNELLYFVGDTLKCRLDSTGGVYIDDIQAVDSNRIVFMDDSGTERTNPYAAVLTLNFGDNLRNDANAIYRVFFTNDDAGDNLGYDYGTANAITVNDFDGDPMTGSVGGASSVQLDYAYDTNVQRGSGSAGTDAPITVVAIGLNTAQFVKATGTIQRSTANVVSLISSLERNYQNP